LHHCSPSGVFAEKNHQLHQKNVQPDADHPGFDRDFATHPALSQEPISLSHRVGFARHYNDETKRGNVTGGRTPMAGCHIG
jgi:hypothetical protein